MLEKSNAIFTSKARACEYNVLFSSLLVFGQLHVESQRLFNHMIVTVMDTQKSQMCNVYKRQIVTVHFKCTCKVPLMQYILRIVGASLNILWGFQTDGNEYILNVAVEVWCVPTVIGPLYTCISHHRKRLEMESGGCVLYS